MELVSKPGIYLLTNRANGKLYVGKADDIKGRIGRHKSSEKGPAKHNCKIINAIKKYGWNSFEILILEVFEQISAEELLLKESDWIKKLDTTNSKIGYNILAFGNDGTGRKHSLEARKKMSEKAMGHTRNKGRKHTEQAKKKMRASRPDVSQENNPFYGRKHSEESRAKMARAQANLDHSFLKKKINQLSLDGDFMRTWDSIREAAITLTGKAERAAAITTVCRGRRKVACGFRWEYKNEK